MTVRVGTIPRIIYCAGVGLRENTLFDYVPQGT